VRYQLQSARRGTDGSLAAIDDRGRQAHQQAYAAQCARRVGARREPDRYNCVEEYNRADRMRLLSEDLSARGWPAHRIEKILGANFAGVFGEVWGG
jgi:membrane dipeptidase